MTINISTIYDADLRTLNKNITELAKRTTIEDAENAFLKQVKIMNKINNKLKETIWQKNSHSK